LLSVLSGKASVRPGIARKLGAWLGTSSKLWLGMQQQGDALHTQR